MSFKNRPKHHNPALWVTVWPDQAKEGARERKDREQELYNREARAFKKANPLCRTCDLIWHGKPHQTKDIHHVHGRAGSLLRDQRFWMPVCRRCHHWIADNIELARKLGLVAEKGSWNNGKAS